MTQVFKIPVFTLTDARLYTMKVGEIFAIDDTTKLTLYRYEYEDNVTPTTTFQSAIDNGYVKPVRAGEIEPTIRPYQPGESYHQNELFTDSTKSKMYIALQDFTAAGDLESDISNGYCKSFNETTYKQVRVSVNSGEIISIQYEKPNVDLNRFVFVEQITAGEYNKEIAFLTFYPGTSEVTFDENWVDIIGDGIGLKTDKIYEGKLYTNSNSVTMYKTVIDINDYLEIGTLTLLPNT